MMPQRNQKWQRPGLTPCEMLVYGPDWVALPLGRDGRCPRKKGGRTAREALSNRA